MYTSEVIYQGELRCKAKHLQSDTVIITDAPVDNYGKGEAFSPTDLLATALGTCMLTIMGIEANKLNVNIDGANLTIKKIMGTLPRRIVKIEITMVVPDAGISEINKELLRDAGINCPVAKSLHPDLIQQILINFI
ncbi:MAG: OsmC family protein [Bacteroidia bacterium]|nr:OsmC family protein [Bacteroidia bacterium]